MKKSKLTFLALLIFSLALFLSGCGPTNKPPSASFSANPTSGEAPLEVSFDAPGSSDPDGSIASYDWDFDDGTTGSGQTVPHSYDSAGNYTVELTVTDDGGATDSTTQSIDVSPPPSNPPTASFTAHPTSGEVPLEVTFDASNSSDSDGNITSYEWGFDDGSTGSGVSGTYTFESSGTYIVELTVTDNDGGTDSTSETISVSEPNQAPTASFTSNPTSGDAPLDVSFDASGSSDPDGNISSYDWDFGDGSTGSGETITHTFDSTGDYTVDMTVTDNDGATDFDTETIKVTTSGNESPTAEFSYDPSNGYPPLEVTFDATSSSDPDGSIVSYSWDFDDGTGGSGAITTHTFYDSGVYDVTLTVYDDDGASSTRWYSVWVKS